MAKIVLHIGTHKTATTTLQDTFHHNADLLAQHGLIYPRLGKATGHHGLIYDWAHLPPFYKPGHGSRAALRDLADRYANGPGTVFVSSEEFSRCDEGHTDLAAIRRLLDAFESFEVICTLRTQWQFIQSVYLEISKKQRPPRPPEMVRSAIDTGKVTGLWVDYNKLLDRLETVFSPEEITLLDYHSGVAAPGGIIGAFLTHLGLGIGADALEPVNQGSSNVSPMPLASWAANVLAQPRIAPEWLVERAGSLLRAHFENKDLTTCIFTAGEIRNLQARFGPLNRELAERRAGIQPGFALSEVLPKDDTVMRGMIDGRFWTRFCREFVRERMQAPPAEG